MIEQFTKEEFESALPVDKTTGEPLWEYREFEFGEHTYIVHVPDRHVGILVRSSVRYDDVSADAGEDSIRLTLINTATGKPLAKKIDAWTQRTTGWQERMVEKIRMLYTKGLEMQNCPQCNGVLVERNGKYGKFMGCSNYPRCKYIDKGKAQTATPVESVSDDDTNDITEVLDMMPDTEFDFEEDEPIVKNEPPKKIVFNDQQLAYINAPVDANIRVMAGPGAGKTASTIVRIVYLIEHGVRPEKIVYVTFTKAMADEGYERISKRLPEVADSALSRQICTIHALCYRILGWEGIKRNVPKDWEVKVALNAIIAGDYKQNIIGEWQYAFEMPGYKEVLYWIDNAKHVGVTPEEDLAYFSRHMISDHAMKVHNARVRFDDWLASHNYITFSDMLYMIEQRLIKDAAFRNKYQAKFSHVLVDECQDLSRQTLFILCVLSIAPTEKITYEHFLRWRNQSR